MPSRRNIAKTLGRLGGLARARLLSGDCKKKIASLGGRARARSFQTARRILDNFNYARAVQTLGGTTIQVNRIKTFKGPLPGHYV